MFLLLSVSGASCRIETLQVKLANKLQPYRPQLHLILRSDPDSFKSSLLHAMGEHHGVTPYQNVTFPAMIGTVDRNSGELVPGLVWQCRKKPFLLDEFKTGERGDSAAVDVLLGVMEQGYYKRKIGLRSSSRSETDETDTTLFYRVENGEIEVRTRLAATIATMKNWDMARSGKYAALTQRCIPIRYSLTDDMVDAVLDGAPIYTHQEFNPPKHVTISRRDFLRIREIASAIRDERKEQLRPVYARTIGDLCRVLAITRRFDSELFRIICYL